MKIYLSLFTILLLTTTLIASNKDCDEILVYNRINPNKDCDNSNGWISIYASSDDGPFKYEWEDDQDNTVKQRSDTYLTGLDGGYYSVNITSKAKPRCTVEKLFFVPGIISKTKEDIECTTIKMPSLVDVDIEKTNKGYNLEISIEANEDTNIGDYPLTLAYMINNNNDIEMFQKSVWTEVPKPSISLAPGINKVIEEDVHLIDGNVYNFILILDYPEFSGSSFSSGLSSNLIRNNDLDPDNRYSTKVINNNNFLTSDYIVYPQPATNRLNINLLSKLDFKSIELLDIQGRIIKETETGHNIENIQFDVSSLDAGLYLLKINSSTNTLIEKVIIK